MIPSQFEYFAPETLDEAISLLGEHGSEAVVLAGGQSLIPLMKLQLATPEFVVDINHIAGLSDISEDDDFLRIGSLTRESDLDRSELVAANYPILQDTTSVIADPIGAQYGDRRRQPGARRPRERSSCDYGGTGSAGCCRGTGRCRGLSLWRTSSRVLLTTTSSVTVRFLRRSGVPSTHRNLAAARISSLRERWEITLLPE